MLSRRQEFNLARFFKPCLKVLNHLNVLAAARSENLVDNLLSLAQRSKEVKPFGLIYKTLAKAEIHATLEATSNLHM